MRSVRNVALGDHPGHRRDGQRQQRCRLEHRRLVVLHVLRIGQRQALHRDHQRGQAADDPPRMAAHQLGGIGVLLLRHDRAAGREASGSVTKPNGWLAQMMISSASRDRCSAHCAAAIR
jgi:hypothetical protein